MELMVITALALGTALATGLGALPLAFRRMSDARWIGRGDALAVGCMLGASVALMQEGARTGMTQTVMGAVLGGLVVLAAKLAPAGHAKGNAVPDMRITTALVSVMALHSAAEGVGVGVAFAGGAELGLMTAIAIAIHNIPEGLAVSLVAVPRGASIARAAWLSVLSSLPQPLLAVPAFLLVEHFETLLPWGFGIAAGAMVAMAVAWLTPDALEQISRTQVALIGLLGLSAMLVAQALVL